MKKVIFLVLLLALVVGGAFAAGGAQQQTGGPARNRPTDVLVVGMTSQPVALDPAATNDQPSSQVNRQIYDTLVVLDSNMSPQPSLATRWEWEGPARIRMFLRQNVRFHNGDILTAQDVKFTLDRASASPHIGHITGMIQRVDVINNLEILITLDNPFVPFLNHLAHPATSIVNERSVREQGEAAYARNPVGTGPFRFVNWVTGASLTLQRFDDHWGGRTSRNIREITFRFISDTSTRLIALETGEIDINYAVQFSDMPGVEANPNLQAILFDSLATDYIGFNVQRRPYDDVRVRQAINYAVDVDALIRAAYFGYGTVARGPVNPMVWASASDTLQPYDFNQTRARQLLAEAGYPNGFETSILVNEGSVVRLDVAEIVQNMLGQVGIRVNIQIVEWAAFLDQAARGDTEMFTLGWVTVTGDPDYGLSPLFHTDNFGAAGNRTFYSNLRLDRILDDARQETNPDRRRQMYYEAQQIIRDEAPWIFTATGITAMASHPSVRGFAPVPGGHHELFSVYFE